MKKYLVPILALVGVALVVVAGVLLLQGAQPAAQAAANEMASQNGTFRLSYTSDMGSVPLNEIHTWTLHVATADGQPVEDAQITVNGGMPAHNHGLPTQPEVTAYLGGGNYRVEGMKFHMGGAWVVDFTVTAGGVTDTARFDLMLK